jgi:3,5-dioxohexanoate:acetyl-CoA acetone transferase
MSADARYAPSVVTAAVTGGDVLPSQSPHLPRGVDAIVEHAVAAAEAGAAVVHLHARDDAGRPSGDPELIAAIVAAVRARSDVVINVSTGGAPGMTADERLAGMLACRPEIATFNLGTMNYEGFPRKERWPQVEADWERAVLENSGEGIFVNTLSMLRRFASAARETSVTPELEAYDLGHLSMARYLIEEGTLASPVRVQLVLGILGGAGNSIDELFHLRELARRILGEHLGALSVAAVGYPMQFRHAAVALALGMDCRVGMEDNLRVRRDQPARRNAELVEVAVSLAQAVGRPLATPTQVRGSLGPWHG